jgi:DNA sulfur modification protein DndE
VPNIVQANQILKAFKVNNKVSVEAMKEADEKAKEEWAYSVGIQAFMFTVPMVMHDIQRDLRMDLKKIAKIKDRCPCAPVGQWGHSSNLATSNDKMPYTPNRDTVYSGLSVSLKAEPVILVVPPIEDRYYSLQIADAYLVNQHYLGTRTTSSKGGNFALVGPHWQGKLPAGVKALRMPNNSALVALRIATYSETDEDVEVIKGYQQLFDAVPLSQWGLAKAKRTYDLPKLSNTSMKKGKLGYFSYAAELLKENPPVGENRTLLTTFKHIGLSDTHTFDAKNLDPSIQRGLARAVQAGIDIVKWKVKFRGTQSENKWNVDFVGGSYGTDYLARAEGAVQGLFVHSPEEAVYFHTYSDSKNEPLIGKNTYKLHFEKGQLPTTSEFGFWSITMYGDDYQLVGNDINRYSIRKSTQGLKYNEDGSLDLYIQATPPEGNESNWLPTPKEGIFRLNFRVYLPDQSVRQWSTVEQYLPGVDEVN